MIESIASFLRYFDAVHRRAVRDVAALPLEADGWAPGLGEGEKAWSINTIVGHLGWSRRYFASAYRGEGWISPPAADVKSAISGYQRSKKAHARCTRRWNPRRTPGSNAKSR